jgi:hypothetical protein
MATVSAREELSIIMKSNYQEESKAEPKAHAEIIGALSREVERPRTPLSLRRAGARSLAGKGRGSRVRGADFTGEPASLPAPPDRSPLSVPPSEAALCFY